jgi:antitoxin VapB
MALSIKTEEADRLARTLARLTGETMTQAVTVALRERLERERERRKKDENLPAKLKIWSDRFRKEFDTRPITQEEWDLAGGDEWDLSLRDKKG